MSGKKKKGALAIGDRVSAAGKGNGTVVWVGKVKKQEMVGVEMDQKVDGKVEGKDGKGKDGKQYFRCKKGHGILQKASYFKKDSGKKEKGKKGKGKKGGKEEKEEKSEGGSKKKGKGGKSKKPAKEEESSPSPPPRRFVNSLPMGVQTDPPEQAFAHAKLCEYILHFEKEKNVVLSAEKEKLTQELRQTKMELHSAATRTQALEYELKMKDVETQSLRERVEEQELEIEDLKVQLEFAEIDLQECKEKLEDGIESFLMGFEDMSVQEKAQVAATNEELKVALEKLQRSTDEIIAAKNRQIAGLQNDLSYIPTLGERVRELVRFEREVEELRWDLQQFADQQGALEEAEKVISDLQRSHAVAQGEVEDWREYVMDLDDERRILSELNDQNDQFIEDLQKANGELQKKLADSNKGLKEKDADIRELQKDMFKLRNELEEVNNAQMAGMDQAVGGAMQLLNTVGAADGSGSGSASGSPVVDDGFPSLDRQQSLMEKAQARHLVNSNLVLSRQVQECRAIITGKIMESTGGTESFVRFNILRSYFPTTEHIQIDENGIRALCHIQRCLEKARQTRGLLEQFFVDPVGSAVRDPHLSEHSHIICPLILRQEALLRAVKKGFLTSAEDDWPALVAGYSKQFSGREKQEHNLELRFDELLQAIRNNTLLEYSFTGLEQDEKKLKSYIKKLFEQFDPEAARKDEQRVDKSAVLQFISETYYRVQGLTISLNAFCASMHAVMHTPVQTTAAITTSVAQAAVHSGQEKAGSGDEAEDEATDEKKDPDAEPSPESIEDLKIPEPSDAPVIQVQRTAPSTPRSQSIFTPTPEIVAIPQKSESEILIEEALKRLHIGSLEKMFRLRNSITETCKEILAKTSPIDIGFYPKKILSLTQLENVNRTSVTQGQLNDCRKSARQALLRVQNLAEAVKKVSGMLLPDERAQKINRLLGQESEAFEEGLLTQMEKTYVASRVVLKLMDSVAYSSFESTDELGDLTSEELEKTRAQVWEVKAAKVRDAIDEAYVMRDQMDEKKREIANLKQELAHVRDKMKDKNNAVMVLQAQIENERKNTESASQLQIEFKQLKDRNDKYVKAIETQTAQNEKLRRDNESLSTAVNQYKKMLEKKKKRRPSRTTEHIEQKKAPPGDQTPRAQFLSPNAKFTFSQPSAEDIPYLDMLQKTVHSLYRRINNMQFDKKMNPTQQLAEIPRSLLQGLPKKIDLDEEKKEETKYDEEEAMTPSTPGTPMGVARKKGEEECVPLMEARHIRQMKELSHRMTQLKATPRVVDITSSSKARAASHEMVGRQMKLRDIQMRFEKLREQLAFEKEKRLINGTIEASAATKHLGPQIGTIEVPLPANGLPLPDNLRVIVPPADLSRLQTVFGLSTLPSLTTNVAMAPEPQEKLTDTTS